MNRRVTLSLPHRTAATTIEELTKDVGSVEATVTAAITDFMSAHCPKLVDGQVSRVAERFALAAAAGELAIAFDILPLSEGEASQLVAKTFEAWFAARDGGEAAEILEGITQVRRFLEQHGDSRFASWNADEAERPRVFNRAGFRKPNDDGGQDFYILPEVWKDEVCRGLHFGTVARALVDRGMMVSGGDGKPQSMHRLPGFGGPKRCYVVTSAIFEGE